MSQAETIARDFLRAELERLHVGPDIFSFSGDLTDTEVDRLWDDVLGHVSDLLGDLIPQI